MKKDIEKLADLIEREAKKSEISQWVRYQRTNDGADWFTNGHWAFCLPPVFSPVGLISQIKDPKNGGRFIQGRADDIPFNGMPGILPKQEEHSREAVEFTSLLQHYEIENKRKKSDASARLFIANGELQGINPEYLRLASLLQFNKVTQLRPGNPLCFWNDTECVGIIMPMRIDAAALKEEMLKAISATEEKSAKAA